MKVLDLKTAPKDKKKLDFELCQFFYLSHDRVQQGFTGQDLAELAIQSMGNQLGLSAAQISTQMRSACYDGEYMKNQVLFNIRQQVGADCSADTDAVEKRKRAELVASKKFQQVCKQYKQCSYFFSK